MTELLTKIPEILEMRPERRISFRDKVRMHFFYRHIGEAAWSALNYSLNADVVSVMQEDERDSDDFQPWLLPEIELPEGEQYADAQPRRMNEEPFIKHLPDGTPIEVRYFVELRNDIDS